METKKPQQHNILKDGFCNIQLTEKEIQALLDVLKFANSAASIVAQQELTKGTPSGAVQMNRYANDSKVLMALIAASLQIGEPEPDQVH